MGKSHRDNHKARKKRGPEAFAKKARRRNNRTHRTCQVCGTITRIHKLRDRICPKCVERLGIEGIL